MQQLLMKKAKLLFAALASFAFAAFATAQNVDVYGVVSDSETGEPIMGAIVQLQGDSPLGCSFRRRPFGIYSWL